jgi:hypothetical protein
VALLDAHVAFAWFVVVSNALVGVWALVAHVRPRVRGRLLWVATAVAQISIFVQVGLGVAAQQRTGIEAPDFHLFYGFVALATVGIIYSYRQQVEAHRFLLYGFGGLFLTGLGIRAMILG